MGAAVVWRSGLPRAAQPRRNTDQTRTSDRGQPDDRRREPDFGPDGGATDIARHPFSPGDSDLSGGVATWVGGTTVQLNTGLTPIATRFVLSVTNGSGPVALVIDPATGVPRVDVLSAAGEFTANLRMEAKLTGSGGDYTPALDLFDALKTGQGAAGDALTSLTQGFFFDAVEDLAVSEHDVNMEQRANEIAGLIGFHFGSDTHRGAILFSANADGANGN
jgi:hypothetical protein